MTVIFTNLQIKEFLKKAYKFIKSNRTFKYVTCITFAVLASVLTVMASGVTVGYSVRYSDEVIAVVSSQADYDKADAIVLDKIDGKDASIDPKFGLTLTVKDNFNTTDEIIEAIINNNDSIIKATALTVNGKLIFCAEGDELGAIVDNRLKAYFVDGAQNTSNFVDDVKVENGYFLKSSKVDLADAQEYVNTLSVETVSVAASQVEIPYETKNVKDSSKSRGYSAVTTKGENGLAEITKETVKLNGEVSSERELSNTVLKEAVTQVVTVGSGSNYISATTRANVASAGFICPIASGKYKISAYYGDGRNHKGIDLSANHGTPIFAVAAGTVTYSGWDGDFGYNVIIQHENGIKTRYAHADALCVKKGDTVAQGDMIASVGSTGWSTGYHLHFEVIVNGTRVNPGPYIGLS